MLIIDKFTVFDRITQKQFHTFTYSDKLESFSDWTEP